MRKMVSTSAAISRLNKQKSDQNLNLDSKSERCSIAFYCLRLGFAIARRSQEGPPCVVWDCGVAASCTVKTRSRWSKLVDIMVIVALL